MKTNRLPPKTAAASTRAKPGSLSVAEKGFPMEDVLADFGLRPDDFPLNK